MTQLSVNINKVATLRNARGENNPNLIDFAQNAEYYGAQGITVHPRPDERHIRYNDVYALKPVVQTDFNIEGFPSEEFCELVCRVRPEQVTLVPDAPTQLTSNSGWDTVKSADFLLPLIKKFQNSGIKVSVFVSPEVSMIKGAYDIGADRVELYTKPYADGYSLCPNRAIQPFIAAALEAKSLGLEVNAGHDLSLDNLAYFYKHIPFLHEVSIGHALICDALYMGIRETVQLYLKCLR